MPRSGRHSRPIRALGQADQYQQRRDFANLSWIIVNGGEAFAAMGTENSKARRFSPSQGRSPGRPRRGPMGMTINEIVFDIGGGIAGGKKFKAVQMGGPSGVASPRPW